MDLLAQAHLGVFQLLSLTTNSSWLPWREGCHASHQPSDASTPGSITVTAGCICIGADYIVWQCQYGDQFVVCVCVCLWVYMCMCLGV